MLVEVALGDLDGRIEAFVRESRIDDFVAVAGQIRRFDAAGNRLPGDDISRRSSRAHTPAAEGNSACVQSLKRPGWTKRTTTGSSAVADRTAFFAGATRAGEKAHLDRRGFFLHFASPAVHWTGVRRVRASPHLWVNSSLAVGRRPYLLGFDPLKPSSLGRWVGFLERSHTTQFSTKAWAGVCPCRWNFASG